jgi:hypothetical protein
MTWTAPWQRGEVKFLFTKADSSLQWGEVKFLFTKAADGLLCRWQHVQALHATHRDYACPMHRPCHACVSDAFKPRWFCRATHGKPRRFRRTRRLWRLKTRWAKHSTSAALGKAVNSPSRRATTQPGRATMKVAVYDITYMANNKDEDGWG